MRAIFVLLTGLVVVSALCSSVSAQQRRSGPERPMLDGAGGGGGGGSGGGHGTIGLPGGGTRSPGHAIRDNLGGPPGLNEIGQSVGEQVVPYERYQRQPLDQKRRLREAEIDNALRDLRLKRDRGPYKPADIRLPPRRTVPQPTSNFRPVNTNWPTHTAPPRAAFQTPVLAPAVTAPPRTAVPPPVPKITTPVPVMRSPEGIGTRSDARLKHDIVELFRRADGIGVYRFRYVGVDTLYVGVVAQDVARVIPQAVSRDADGYLRVDYQAIGVRLREWSF